MLVFTPVCRNAKHAGAPTDTLQPNRDSRSSKAQWEDIMHCIKLACTSLAAFMLLGAHAEAAEFSAHFSGFQEVGGVGAGQTGAIFSQGKGTLELDLNKNANALVFKLTYSGLGSGVTQAHVHFGKVHVAGGIIAFFCSNLGNGPSGTPACPQAGTVTGTITSGMVIGPTPQGIAPGNFDALVAALTSNTAYGNIHTVNFPAGEIRGQIRREGDRD